MPIAVIADVHANLAALTAVLEALESHRHDALLCLGDLVGYGAEPQQCVALLRELTTSTVVGNHDHDVVNRGAAAGTRPEARRVQSWTREQLDDVSLRYLAGLPRHHVHEQTVMAVHGCYLNDRHYHGYVTSTMLEQNLKAVRDNPEWPRIALCGHTHFPSVGWLRGRELFEPPPAGEVRWPRGADAVLLNPGSVGQPRDGDPRASFLLLDADEGRAWFHRVEYDIDHAVRTIEEQGLPRQLADRLKEGR